MTKDQKIDMLRYAIGNLLPVAYPSVGLCETDKEREMLAEYVQATEYAKHALSATA